MADFSVAREDGSSSPSIERLGTAELLFQAAQSMGLSPEWVTPNGVFAYKVAGKERYINLARSPLNSVISSSLAKNKYLTRRVLARHGAQNIPFIITNSYKQASEFLHLHEQIVAKPISGSGAQDIRIISSPEQLSSIKHLDGYILEKYILGSEYRYLVLNGRVLAVHQSDYGTSVEKDRALERISYDETAWDPALVTSSIKIADALGLRFAAVDFMLDSKGYAYVLEVNSMPGLKWFHAPSRGPAVDVAGQFMQSLFVDSI